MEAARRLDEWRVLSKKIPSVDLIPEFVILENREGQINLNTMEWLLLSKIDGQRSVRGIAKAAGLSVFDAAKLLYGLVATGLIRLKDPAVVAAAAAAAGPSSPTTREGATSEAPPLLTQLAPSQGRVRGAPRPRRRERGPEALPAREDGGRGRSRRRRQ